MKKTKVGIWRHMAIFTLAILLFLTNPSKVGSAGKENIPSKSSKPPEEIPQILLDIAKCESRNKQFNKDGTVHMGEINPLDTGKWQINQKYHLKRAQKLGMDIFTLEGNTAYAIYLYKKEGTTPWNWSKGCWGKKQ